MVIAVKVPFCIRRECPNLNVWFKLRRVGRIERTALSSFDYGNSVSAEK